MHSPVSNTESTQQHQSLSLSLIIPLSPFISGTTLPLLSSFQPHLSLVPVTLASAPLSPHSPLLHGLQAAFHIGHLTASHLRPSCAPPTSSLRHLLTSMHETPGEVAFLARICNSEVLSSEPSKSQNLEYAKLP